MADFIPFNFHMPSLACTFPKPKRFDARFRSAWSTFLLCISQSVGTLAVEDVSLAGL
jgi:hypothetical protein